jgi:hypothetical protein
MKLLLAVFLVITVSNVQAGPHPSEMRDSLEQHHHHGNEIAISTLPVYFVKEKMVAFGLHSHYTRRIADSDYGLGVCAERTFGSHGHYTAGIMGTWMPGERLNLSISPSLSFENFHSKADFGMHFDVSYEYDIGRFHVGPDFEAAYDPEDVHLSLGLHVGYGF